MASKSKTAQGRKLLDYSMMTDDELLRELAHMYDTLLGRLNTHLCVGTGKDEDIDAEPVPTALEAGIALAGRLDRLTGDFEHGVFGRRKSLTGWTWGRDRFECELRDAAAAQVLGIEDDET